MNTSWFLDLRFLDSPGRAGDVHLRGQRWHRVAWPLPRHGVGPFSRYSGANDNRSSSFPVYSVIGEKISSSSIRPFLQDLYQTRPLYLHKIGQVGDGLWRPWIALLMARGPCRTDGKDGMAEDGMQR